MDDMRSQQRIAILPIPVVTWSKSCSVFCRSERWNDSFQTRSVCEWVWVCVCVCVCVLARRWTFHNLLLHPKQGWTILLAGDWWGCFELTAGAETLVIKFCSSNIAGSGAHTVSCPMGTGDFTRGWSGQGVKLTTQLYLVPSLRKRGAIPQIPHYVFMAWCLIRQREICLLRQKLINKYYYWHWLNVLQRCIAIHKNNIISNWDTWNPKFAYPSQSPIFM
jgi:hypothetical protein